MTEDPSQDIDPQKIWEAARSTHRLVRVVIGAGILLYLLVTAFNVYMNVLGLPQLRGRLALTIPTDTALGLLGVTGAVLVAFIVSMWTSAQLPVAMQSAYGLGRRLVLVDVIVATGAGSMFIGLAGALHGWGEHVNVVVSIAVLGLSVALAYIAAEVGEFIKRDQPVSETVSELARHREMNRMRTARECWLTRSHRAGLRQRHNSLLARLRQNLACIAIAAVIQCLPLLAWGGLHKLALYLSLTVGCLAWSIVVGQSLTHHVALLFVRRYWLAFSMVSLLGMLVIAVNASLALAVASFLRQRTGMPSIAAGALAWSTFFVPLLLCVAGLTVVPSAWRRYRPLREIRWGVIRGVSRRIDKLSRSEADNDRTATPAPHVLLRRRLGTAIRTATGVEPLAGAPGP